MRRFRGLLLLLLLTLAVLPVASLSKSAPAPADRGEGVWGLDGKETVRIFDVNVTSERWYAIGGTFGSINGIVGPKVAIGGLRNLSSKPIQNIVITVGEHENGDTIVYGADRLDASQLDRDEVWRWSVNPNKGIGYEVLKVTVDGQPLTRLRH